MAEGAGGRAVVAVSSHPAIDRLALVRDARAGGVARALAALETAGGKAAHAAEVAGRLGAAAELVAAADDRFAALARTPVRRVPTARTRATFTVVDERDGDVLEIHEPGVPLAPEAARALLAEATAAVAGARVAICAGSLPEGLDPGFHAAVVRAAGGFTVVDTSSGPALAAALAAAPDLVKPNLAEARALLGEQPPEALARALVGAGAGWAWLSLGAGGSLLAGSDGSLRRLRAPAPARVVNAVGAGDALVGGLAAGLARGMPVPEAAALGVAAATDKVGRLGFADVDPARVEALAAEVVAT